MKKNWMKTCSVLWTVVAIVLFAGAGIGFNVFDEDLGQMIVPPLVLVIAGFVLGTLSCVSAYKSGKGEILTPDDLENQIFWVRGQSMTSGKPVVIVESATGEIRAVRPEAALKEPLPEYVFPSESCLIPADAHKEREGKRAIPQTKLKQQPARQKPLVKSPDIPETDEDKDAK